MIGKKKLSTIRAEIRERFVSQGFDVERWFGEQIRKLDGHPPPDPQDVESLKLIRQALAGAAKAAPKKGRRRANSR